jgi:hypothetical protein
MLQLQRMDMKSMLQAVQACKQMLSDMQIKQQLLCNNAIGGISFAGFSSRKHTFPIANL